MTKLKNRILALEVAIIILAVLLIANFYIIYQNKQDIGIVNLNQVIGALANDIATSTTDKDAQQVKIQAMVQQLEQRLQNFPDTLTVFNAGSIIKPGKLVDYSETILHELRQTQQQ